MSKLNNQLAFPLEYEEKDVHHVVRKSKQLGFTKLEQVSAMILQGLVSNPNLVPNETDLDYAIMQSIKSAEKLLILIENKK